MRIAKTIVQITVLHASDEPVDGRSVEEIGREIDEGMWLGGARVVSTTLVPKGKVRSECLKLGNDGSFFENDLEGES